MSGRQGKLRFLFMAGNLPPGTLSAQNHAGITRNLLEQVEMDSTVYHCKLDLTFCHIGGILILSSVYHRLTPGGIPGESAGRATTTSGPHSYILSSATGVMSCSFDRESTGSALNATGPVSITFQGGFMSFTKFPSQVRQAVLNRELSLRQLDVYLCLSSHCDFRTGDVYQWVSMSFVAGEIGCHKSTVSRVVKHLRKLGLLVNGTGLHGTLVGFASRPYKSAEDTRQKSARQKAIQSAVQSASGHQIPDVDATRRVIKELQLPARNGSERVGNDNFDSKEDKASFASTLARVTSKYSG